MDSANLIVLLNSEAKTRLDSPTGLSSAIDLSLCDLSLVHLLEWTALPDFHNSDHFSISIQYQYKVVIRQNYKIRPRWKIFNANWKLYVDSIISKIPATE